VTGPTATAALAGVAPVTVNGLGALHLLVAVAAGALAGLVLGAVAGMRVRSEEADLWKDDNARWRARAVAAEKRLASYGLAPRPRPAGDDVDDPPPPVRRDGS
jgi:hypothetical protein